MSGGHFFSSWENPSIWGGSPQGLLTQMLLPPGFGDTPLGVLFIYGGNGIRKAGLGAAGAKNSPVDCFLGRGRIPGSLTASRRGVGKDPATLRTETPFGCPFYLWDNGIRKAVKKTAGGLFTGIFPVRSSATVILSQTSGLSFRIIQPYTAPKYPDIRKGNRYAGTFR